MAGYQLIVYVDYFGPQVCQAQVFVLLKLPDLRCRQCCATCSFAVHNTTYFAQAIHWDQTRKQKVSKLTTTLTTTTTRWLTGILTGFFPGCGGKIFLLPAEERVWLLGHMLKCYEGKDYTLTLFLTRITLLESGRYLKALKQETKLFMETNKLTEMSALSAVKVHMEAQDPQLRFS